MTLHSTMARVLSCLVLAAALPAVPARAQQPGAQPGAAAPPAGIQGSFVRDVDNLSRKFTGLAEAMAGKYDWRPGEGVRSVGDVFNLIVTENRMLANTLSSAPAGDAPAAGGAQGGAAARPAPITDPAQMQEALRSSYDGLRQALAGLSGSELGAAVKLFGRDMTKQDAALLLLMDQHEHLGQSIAYARTNGVVPPWSRPAQ